MPEKKEYKPINCSFYDRLELWAMHKDPVVVFYNDEDNIQMLTGVIHDIYSRQKVEYLLMDDQTELRLDSIISVNGIELQGFC